MSNIIDIIGKLLGLRKELPTPIYYFFVPPMAQVLPLEIASSVVTAGEEIWSATLVIENMSNRVLQNIRIKIPPVQFQYKPRIYSHDSTVKPTLVFNDKNEININSIDPKEAIYIELFPSPDHHKKLTKPDVIIGDQLLTPLMQKYGSAKKYPPSASFWLIAAFGLLSFCFAFYTVYSTHKKSEDLELIQDALNLAKACRMTVLNRSEINEYNIQTNKMGLPAILKINQVSSVDQLLQKEKIIACK